MIITTVMLAKVVALIYLILWCICGYRIHKQQEYIVWWMRNNIWSTILESMFMAFLTALVLTVLGGIVFALVYL